MTAIDLVFSGSGTLMPCHIGAWDALMRAGYDPVRVGGTSGGGIVAAAIAKGMTPDEAMLLGKRVLAGRLLDPGWWFFSGWGIHRWRKIRALLAKHLPGNMGDVDMELRIMVVDLETQQPVEVTSSNNPDVPIVDVLAATSAIPVFAKVQKIKGLPGTFVDGGVSTNFAMGVFDDAPLRPTVGVRLISKAKRRKIRNTVDWATALVGSMHDAANHSYVSSKRWANVIEVRSKGNGMDFTIGSDTVDALHDEGFQAAKEWARKQG